MAKRGSSDASLLLVDGYNLIGSATEFSEKREATFDDTTALGDTFMTQGFADLKKFTLSQKGFFDDAAGGSNEALSAMSGANRLVCYGLSGNAIGRAMTGFSGTVQHSYERVAAIGKFTRANAEYLGNGQMDDGRIVQALGAVTAAGDSKTSKLDNTTSSASGGAAYLQVPAVVLGGYTSWTVKLVHSADGTTWADLATFTAVTAGPSAQRVAVSGTVNRYVAATWTLNGTGTSPSLTFLVGFARF